MAASNTPSPAATVPQSLLEEELKRYHVETEEVRAEVSSCKLVEEQRQEAHDAQLEDLAAELDELDAALVAELAAQAEEAHEARELLGLARGELSEMEKEVVACQAESELAVAQTRAAASRKNAEELRRAWEEQLLEEEVATLEATAGTMAAELRAQHDERFQLEQQCVQLGQGLQRAVGQIRAYEDWSRGVNHELREVAAELQADRAKDIRERRWLQERAATLEGRRFAALEESRSGCSIDSGGVRADVVHAARAPFQQYLQDPLGNSGVEAGSVLQYPTVFSGAASSTSRHVGLVYNEPSVGGPPSLC